jgi:ferric-dicitrate binding protein FerR (iron transport regulator)
VVKPDSDKAWELFAQRRLDAYRIDAQNAVAAWNTGGSHTDLVKLDAAIEALQAYRLALTAADSEVRKA